MVNMEDTWICIEDDDSHRSASDSDRIDSETEAELYSSIHYEENLNSHEPKCVNIFISKPVVSNQNGVSNFLTPVKDIFYVDDKKEIFDVNLKDTSKNHVSNHQDYLEDKRIPDRNPFSIKKSKQDLNPAKKFKLDSEKEQCIDLCPNNSKEKDQTESSRHKSLNHIEINSSDHGTEVKQMDNIIVEDSNVKQSPKKNNISIEDSNAKKSSEKNNITVEDSSDSDSIILTETNSQVKSDFTTNLLHDEDIIYINSSDSDAELPSFQSILERQSLLKNMSMPNIKMGEKREGLWHINDEDLYRRKKYSRRYHENSHITCTNCSKKGHTFRTCPVPKMIKCFICGGSHLGSRCINRMCSNCYDYGHDSRRCQRRPNNFFCTLCRFRGHIRENCPDLWRRYHLTTESANIVQGRRINQDTDMYCWNCGDCGHFGGVCQVRYSSNLTTWPCVVSYDDPGELLKKRLNGSKSRSDNVMQIESIQIGGNASIQIGGNRNASIQIGGNRNASIQFGGNRNTSMQIGGNRNGNIGISRRNKPAHLKQRNDLDTTHGSTEGRKKKKKNKRTKSYQTNAQLMERMDKRFQQVQEILGEQDFPRTPKQKISQNSEVPEVVTLSMEQQEQTRRKNSRRWRRRKRSGVNAQNLQEV